MRELDQLALAVGELADLRVGEAGEPEPVEHLVGDAASAPRPPAAPGGEPEVLAHGEAVEDARAPGS